MNRSVEIVVVLVLLMVPALVSAQDAPKRNHKLYDIWITNDKLNPSKKKGELFEVKDSSILMATPGLKRDFLAGNFKTSEIPYNQIELIKLRRTQSVNRGALIGFVGGVGLSIFAVLDMDYGEAGGLQTLVMVTTGSMITAMGSGIGALAGSFKIRIPVEKSYSNFDRNKRKLQNFAYVQNKSFGIHEHESYYGILLGPLFPLGGLTDKSKEIHNAKSGYFSSLINLGYMLKRNIGISATIFDNRHNAGNDSELSWFWEGIALGPLFTFPLREKFNLDLKPRIGYSSLVYVISSDRDTMDGLLINPVTSLRWNFAKRWSFITETGYMLTRTREKLAGNYNFQTYNLAFGINYRFR